MCDFLPISYYFPKIQFFGIDRDAIEHLELQKINNYPHIP